MNSKINNNNIKIYLNINNNDITLKFVIIKILETFADSIQEQTTKRSHVCGNRRTNGRGFA